MQFKDLFLPNNKEFFINNQPELISLLKANKDLINQDNISFLVTLMSDQELIKPIISQDLLGFCFDHKILTYEFTDLVLIDDNRFFIPKLFFVKNNEFLSLAKDTHVLNKLIDLYQDIGTYIEIQVFLKNFFSDVDVLNYIIQTPYFFRLKGFLTLSKSINRQLNHEISLEKELILKDSVLLFCKEKIVFKIKQTIGYYISNIDRLTRINELIKTGNLEQIQYELSLKDISFNDLIQIIRENFDVDDDINTFLESCAVKINSNFNSLYEYLKNNQIEVFLNNQSLIMTEDKILDLLNSGTNYLYLECLNSLKSEN